MAIEHAILVSLLERPGSGYELARRFERSIGYFWTASHQQIYRVLKRMESEGWVDVQDVPQQGRPDKKEYSVAALGRTALSTWLHEPIEPESIRHDLAVKIRGAAFDDPAALIGEVERHRQAHTERLARYLAGEERDFTGPDAPGAASDDAAGAADDPPGEAGDPPGEADAPARAAGDPPGAADDPHGEAGDPARAPGGSLDAGRELQHVVLRGGIAYERMTLAWLDDVLATLHRLGSAR